MKPLSTDPPATVAPSPAVSADGDVRTVRFDRPLVDHPGWADPRLARQVAQATGRARELAVAEGYAAGWAQGRRAAAKAAQEETTQRADREEAARRQIATRGQALLASLAQTARTLADQAIPAWDELVEVLLEGALSIASASLARELATVDSEVVEAVRTSLRLLPSAETVTVLVNPADAGLLAAGTKGDPLPAGVRVTTDPQVPAGTVRALTPLQSLATDLRAGLRAAAEVLEP
jgi:flagellar assembly protein FliH